MSTTNRQIIISPVVYLIEERRTLGIIGMFNGTPPRLVADGWILRLLPKELHAEAARRTLNADPTEIDQIRLRAIELGLATIENVDDVIYNMPVAQYLNLARDFPRLSRVHFQPAYEPHLKSEWPDDLPLPVYHERSVIISPLVYLMEKHRCSRRPRCIPQKIESGGWILDLLPEALHTEAERKVPRPKLKTQKEILEEMIINRFKKIEDWPTAKAA
jgi:hypothetical protein